MNPNHNPCWLCWNDALLLQNDFNESKNSSGFLRVLSFFFLLCYPNCGQIAASLTSPSASRPTALGISPARWCWDPGATSGSTCSTRWSPCRWSVDEWMIFIFSFLFPCSQSSMTIISCKPVFAHLPLIFLHRKKLIVWTLVRRFTEWSRRTSRWWDTLDSWLLTLKCWRVNVTLLSCSPAAAQ